MTATRRCRRSIPRGCWPVQPSIARSKAAGRKRLSAGRARLQSRVFASTGEDRATGVTRPSLTPHIAGDLDAAGQLGPLLFLGQQIALLGAGEAALRRQAELLQGCELR